MNVLERLHLLVITLNMNDAYNEAKLCGILNNFIRKLKDFFFIIIGEKASTNLLLKKTNYLRKLANLKCLYGPMYLPLDVYPPYSDKQSGIFEANINKEFRYIHGYKNHVE